MKNLDLLKTGTRLNRFTRALARKCGTDNRVMVRMRNGTYVRVRYLAKYDPIEGGPGFKTDDHRFCWEVDGKSITSADFDLIECEEIGT